MGNVPLCVGVPESVPFAARVRPVGSALAVVKVTAPMAFEAVKLWLKAALTVPLLVAGLLTVMTWQLITRLYVAPLAEQPLPSTTCTTMGKVPVCVGVPESVPLVASVSPAGNVLAVGVVVAATASPAVEMWLKEA